MYALITGASSGIGLEIARILAGKGYNLILVARREERLKQLRRELRQRHDIDVIPYATDISDPDNCYKLLAFTRSYDVGILVNAAGFGKIGSYNKVPLKSELDMIQTNIVALQILTKRFAKRMNRGRILNIASIAAFQPGPAFATYSATKSYVFHYSMAVNYELRRERKNVQISVLCPGPVSTEFDSVAGTNFSLRSISAKECATAAVKGLLKGKCLIVPSFQTSVLRLLSRVAPYKLLLPIEYEIQTRKLK